MGGCGEPFRMMEFLEIFSDKFKRCLRAVSEPYFEEEGLKIHHLLFISVIGRNAGMCQKDITSYLPYDKSRVSMVIAELIAMDLVKNVARGRTTSLVLTAGGEGIDSRFRLCVDDFRNELISELDENELKSLNACLGKFDSRMDEILGAHAHVR